LAVTVSSRNIYNTQMSIGQDGGGAAAGGRRVVEEGWSDDKGEVQEGLA
jgi:hypothetical protein